MSRCTTRFHVGQVVWYVLPKGPDRPTAVYWPCQIRKIGPRRVTIEFPASTGRRPRNVSPFSLTADPPDGVALHE